MATSYQKKGGRGEKEIAKSNKTKVASGKSARPRKPALGVPRPFVTPLGQDPPIIIKPGTLSIVVGSDAATAPVNRLIEKGSPGEYEYRHNKNLFEVKALAILDVDTNIETPVILPDRWRVHIYYKR